MRAGECSSVNNAVRTLVDERIAERDAEEGDDLAWAKPLVDEGEAELADGKFYTLEEFEAHMDAELQKLKG